MPRYRYPGRRRRALLVVPVAVAALAGLVWLTMRLVERLPAPTDRDRAVAAATTVPAAAEGDGPAIAPVDPPPPPTSEPASGRRRGAGSNRPPVAVASAGPAGLVGMPVTFSADGSADPEGGPLAYRWTFGDGSFPPATEASPSHAFRQSGRFQVVLTVTDAEGASARAVVQVEQRRPTAPVALATPEVPTAPGTTKEVRVWWSGQRPDTAVLAKVCRRSIEDPRFREGLDCSLLSEVASNGTSSGSGWLDVPVFRGPEPGGDGAWGCFAPGDPVPAGIEPHTTCWVRITNNVGANTRDDREVPFTLTG